MEQMIKESGTRCKNWASEYVQESQTFYCWDASVVNNFFPAIFDAECQDRENGQASLESGRGKIKRVARGTENFVVRHFYRGGWIRHISRDLYFLPPTLKTRVEAEINTLQALTHLHLPVPEPVGLRVQRVGPCCRMDIVLKEIANTKNLVEVLCARSVEASVWQDIGRTISKFHRARFCHADLNAHNILLDADNKVWLVDFDKSCFMTMWPWFWKQRNLARLHRSLSKERQKNATFNFDESAWTLLGQGYCSQ